MATTNAAATPSQFTRLLRQSRFATFDPSIAQVYTAPPAYAAHGEWGLKRPLPSSPPSVFGSAPNTAPFPGALRYVEVSNLDNTQGLTSWTEREKETLFVKRWAQTNAKLNVAKPESGGQVYAEPGSYGPRPSTTFLKSTERYFPSEIPGPIELTPEEEAKESPKDREARLYNNEWRNLMKHHASRGAADPSYKTLDFDGERSPNKFFGPDTDKFTTRPRMMINYNALSDKEFDNFVAKIRNSRDDWKSYFQAKERNRLLGMVRKRQEKQYAAAVRAQQDAEQRGATKEPLPVIDPEAELSQMSVAEIDMLEQSREVDATREAFRMLEERTVRKTTQATSAVLPGNSQPNTMHPHAGLQYSQPDPVFSSVLADPVPGRVVHEVSSKGDRDLRRFGKVADGRSVLVGGRVAYLHAPLRAHAPPTLDWSRQEPKRGTALFRIVDAYRTSRTALAATHKDMLAPRNDLGYIHSNLQLVAPTTQPNPPGSPDYVGQLPRNPEKPALRALGADARPHPPLLSLFHNDRRRPDPSKRRFGRNQSSPSNSPTPAHDTKEMLDSLDRIVNPDQ